MSDVFVEGLKELKSQTPMRFTAAYDPAGGPEFTTYDLSRPQKIVVYTEPPLFIMSPGIRVYRKASIIEFDGYIYIESFKPEETELAEEPTMQLTINPVVQDE